VNEIPPSKPEVVRFNAANLSTPVTLYDASGSPVLQISNEGETTIGVAGNPVVVVSRTAPAVPALKLGALGGSVGFYGVAPVPRQTLAAPSLPDVIAALRVLGLIA
jgi:hypothetical protein